ncbi:undecaprenyl-diphosphate phosphatase [Lyngbya confervoides]|uniref:Undecaprenyl-diphosphatase n=1 Tax=Lyngbya confervoides BDU141951 TaxID=1574623 RepID=A0ABD4T1Q9_9CYAN|nr:undecaprenyl-diphosphate phosphatase [Lyngbya confervoides]MCM1982522.1 undecaprenyl-diphosphate phosphatase [Lyngbya confervoides BDU141951]
MSESPGLIVSLLQALVLGLVQGITEFLPISSTAHLLIWTKVFHWQMLGEKYFVDAIQFGSVIAVVLYFRRDIQAILIGSWQAYQAKNWHREEWKIFLGIVIGTVPALAGGMIYKIFLPEATQTILEGAMVISVMSIVMALLLGLAETFGQHKRDFNQLTLQDGLGVGLGQMLALIPGASRSGSTITTALFLGLKRDTAARFSFLLGLPTLTLATLYQSLEIVHHLNALPALLIGITSTFIFSYLSIAWLLQYLRRQSAWIFVWYRLGFGLALISAIGAGVISMT